MLLWFSFALWIQFVGLWMYLPSTHGPANVSDVLYCSVSWAWESLMSMASRWAPPLTFKHTSKGSQGQLSSECDMPEYVLVSEDTAEPLGLSWRVSVWDCLDARPSWMNSVIFPPTLWKMMSNRENRWSKSIGGKKLPGKCQLAPCLPFSFFQKLFFRSVSVLFVKPPDPSL